MRCVQVRGRTPFAADWYMLSSADARANASNVAAGGAIGAFNASTAYYGLSLSPQCAPAPPVTRSWQLPASHVQTAKCCNALQAFQGAHSC